MVQNEAVETLEANWVSRNPNEAAFFEVGGRGGLLRKKRKKAKKAGSFPMKKCWRRRVVALLAVLYVDPYVRKVRIKSHIEKKP